MASHRHILDLDSYDAVVQRTILDLEINWDCVNERHILINQLKSLDTKDLKLKSYLKLIDAKNYFSLNNYDSSLYILNMCELESDFPFMGRLHYQKAANYTILHAYSQALTEISNAEVVFANKSDNIGLINSKIALMFLYIRVNNESFVQNTYLQVISLCQKHNYDEGLVRVYNHYGIYAANWDVSFAHELLKKGWELSKNFNFSLKISNAVTYLKFLIRNELYDEFTDIYAEVSLSCERSCYLSECSIVNTIYAHRMSIAGKIDSARFFNEIALKQRKESGNRYFVGYSYLNLASNSMAQKDFIDTRIKLDSAREYLYNGGNTSTKRYYYKYLLNYYKSIESSDSVISVFTKLSNLDSQFYNEQQKLYMSKLKAESDIQRKLENEKYLIQVDAEKFKFRYVLSIVALLTIVLGIILWLLFNKSRSFNILKTKSILGYRSLRTYEKEVIQLKSIFQNAITGFFILDKELKIRYVNKRAERLLSKSNDEIITKSFLDFLDEEFHKEFEATFQALFSDKINREIQAKIWNKGTDQWVSFSISPMFINNELESILVIAMDVSTRVKALELEKTQRTILQTLFNSVTESILLMDGTGTMKAINQTGADRLGKSVTDLIGINYFKILPEAIRGERVQRVNQAIEKKDAVIYSESIGSYHTLVSIYPKFDDNGKLEYLAEFTQDITDRILAHEQINSLRQKVLRSQMNPHFIFNSLNAIQSYILKSDTEHAVKYLNSFAKLIRMILDSSRFDYINLQKEVYILEYYLELQQLRFGDKFIWTLDVDSNIDTDSILIPPMLAQPFIENAIEHGLQHLSGKGVMKISFTKAKESIIFKVSDNGIGREASREMQKNSLKSSESLSTKIFNDRLFTLNKYSGQKITHDIIDLTDDKGTARGTMVIINIPIIYRSNII